METPMSNIDLTILVCGVHTRVDTFLPKIQGQLYGQYNSLEKRDQDRVEIIVLVDNKKQTVGRKRNLMVGMAQGGHVAFVDDDDRVSNDYIVELLKATESNSDAIVFQTEVRINGGPPGRGYFSKDFKKDFDNRYGYHRIPNHLCGIKRSIAVKLPFPEIGYGEDVIFSKELLPYLKTERKIDKILYYYDFNASTSETVCYSGVELEFNGDDGMTEELGPRLGNDYTDTLRYVLAQKPQGYALEFGVATGKTLSLIAEVMPAVGFDSFEGLPENWRTGFETGMFACAPPVVNAELVIGMFEDTLPKWTPPGPIGLVHMDADLYSSTATVLKYIGPYLQPGCIIVFDEWYGYPGCEDHEQRAWTEFTTRTGVTWKPIGHGPEQLALQLLSLGETAVT